MRYKVFIATLLFTLCLFAAAAGAQVTTANIVGTVADASGAVVPNVKVTATNRDTGLTRVTVTSSGSSRSRGCTT